MEANAAPKTETKTLGVADLINAAHRAELVRQFEAGEIGEGTITDFDKVTNDGMEANNLIEAANRAYLVYKSDGSEVKVGELTLTSNCEKVRVHSFQKPDRGEGKVCLTFPGQGVREYCVSVIGAEWRDESTNRAGCGKAIRVIGTNGWTMPCGASLTQVDGTTAPEYCEDCKRAPTPESVRQAIRCGMVWRDGKWETPV